MIRFLSLFSGIEAASVAWMPLGWEAVAFAEIAPFPSAVLAHHYPSVPNLGDVEKIDAETLAPLGRIDVVIGGFPCQDLSVAGRRAGLQGKRSSLFHEAVRIANVARARFLVIENVPGLYSSQCGRDFAVVVGTLAGCEFDVPDGGWRNAGVAVGPRGLVEWATLDAQFFNLAQRRERVFLVRRSGDWRGAAAVLLEPSSLRGDPAPSRETGARVAASLTRGADSGGRGGYAGRRREDDENLAACPVLAGTIGSKAGGGRRDDLDGHDGAYIAHEVVAPIRNHRVEPGHNGMDAHIVAHSLRASGFDASEDGTGRGTPIVFDRAQVTSKSNYSNPQPGDPCHPLAAGSARDAMVAYQCHGTNVGPFGAVRAGNGNETGGVPFIPILEPGRRSGRSTDDIRVGGGIGEEGDPMFTLNAQRPHGVGVRRLTPRECERLQGFPDDYTLVQYRSKPASDGPRYQALGNSMAVPCIRWIGRRIAAFDSVLAC